MEGELSNVAFKVVRTLLYYDETSNKWTPRLSNLSTDTVAAIVAGAEDIDYRTAIDMIEKRKYSPYQF